MNKKFLIAAVFFSFIFANSANAAIFPNWDIATPDSPFYFLQTWKESIQTFFAFGAENKAKQYLHLAEVRLAEYQKMVEKGKTEIAEKTLNKYEDQLNRALTKAQELKDQDKDIEDLSQKVKEATSKHLEILQENLKKIPEQAKKGIENAIENSRKGVEKIIGNKACTQEAKQCPDGSYVSRTGSNCEFAECPVLTSSSSTATSSFASTSVSELSKSQFLPHIPDWPTFQNNNYGFSVKYPPFLKVWENPQTPEAYLYSVSFENPLADQATAGQKIVFNISIFKDNKQLQDAFKSLTLDDKGKAIVGGYEAKKLFTPKGGAASFTEATIYTIAAKNTALIFYGADFSEVSDADMAKILASFKFTPQ